MGRPIIHISMIYAIRCTETGRVYIGRTYDLERRLKEHFNELRNGNKTIKAKVFTPAKPYGQSTRIQSKFQQDYDEYGEGAFEVFILEENIAPSKCKEREAYWIAEYCATDPRYGYNRLTESSEPAVKAIVHGLPPNIAKEKLLAELETDNTKTKEA